ncbi:MAG: hypothetical protein LV477_00845 [Candidatus Nitrosotalea sp.]|nr:hypothetical protein [Candidatus Nitrosotalea sp.]
MTVICKLENNLNISDSINFCKKVLSSGRKIQSVEIVNKKGRSVECITKSNVFSLPIHKKEIFLMSEILQESMRKEHNDYFGNVNYSYTSREKVAIFSFRLGENMLIVISLMPSNPDTTAKKIISLICNTTVSA